MSLRGQIEARFALFIVTESLLANSVTEAQKEARKTRLQWALLWRCCREEAMPKPTP